jgi:hypothetical protein
LSGQPNIQAKLRDGMEAARRGDKIAARRLLQQVLTSDRNNELALMWMASVVDTLAERRAYLERAVQINPHNERAREALRRLGVEAPPAPRGAAPSAPSAPGARGTGVEASGRRSNTYLLAAAAVALIVLIVAAAYLLNNRIAPQPGAEVAAQSTFNAALNPTITTTPPPASETALPGVVVTLDPNALPSLPPTFTPSPTRTLSPTPFPSLTPLPLSDFGVVYSEFDPESAQPSLFSGNADGSGEVRLGSGDAGFGDVAVDAAGERIAFVRMVVTPGQGDEPEVSAPELFTASLDDPQNAIQITNRQASTLGQPSWSPDGAQIVFASDEDGDSELWIVDADGGNLRQLTDNQAHDADPAFSPDGTQIVFVSDVESPGFSEVYTIAPDGTNLTRLTDLSGSQYAPAWSPDGSQIVYVSDRGGDGDLYVMDADGQRSTLLTVDDGGAEDRSPRWSPDGLWIAFLSNREDDEFRWHRIDLNGSVTRMSVLTGRAPQSLAFLPFSSR